MTVGDRIRTARTLKGWTQSELSKACGISRNSISKYESDGTMPRMPQIKSIAKALGISYEGLMTGKKSVPTAYLQSIDSLRSRVIEERLSVLRGRFIQNYDRLNTIGQRKAYEYIDDLTRIDIYRADTFS